LERRVPDAEAKPPTSYYDSQEKNFVNKSVIAKNLGFIKAIAMIKQKFNSL